jgi:Uncharacterized protein related to plant photosystem II stability/assembly factor
MRRYLVRYLPLLVIALLLIPLRERFAVQHVTNNASDVPTTNGQNAQVVRSAFPLGPTLFGLAMPTAQEGWAVGGTFTQTTDARSGVKITVPVRGTILHFQNDSWLAGATLPRPLFSIAMSSAVNGWAVGYAGELAHYDGQRWQLASSPTSANLRGVVLLSADEGWAVGASGTIIHFHDQHWTLTPTPTHEDLFGISMLSADDGWAVGSNGTLLHYSAGRWQQIPSPTSKTLYSVTTLSANDGWAVGNGGIILHYRDGIWGGVKFLATGQYAANVQGQQRWLGIVMTAQRSGWIVGDNDVLGYSNELWSEQSFVPYAPPYLLYGIAMNTPGELWAVGSYDAIYYYSAGKWQLYTQIGY